MSLTSTSLAWPTLMLPISCLGISIESVGQVFYSIPSKKPSRASPKPPPSRSTTPPAGCGVWTRTSLSISSGRPHPNSDRPICSGPNSHPQAGPTILAYLDCLSATLPEPKPVSLHLTSPLLDILAPSLVPRLAFPVSTEPSCPLHLHINTCIYRELLIEDPGPVLHFDQLLSAAASNAVVIFFSGNHPSVISYQAVLLARLLGRLGIHLLHVYDGLEGSRRTELVDHQLEHPLDDPQSLEALVQVSISPVSLERILEHAFVLLAQPSSTDGSTSPSRESSFFTFNGSQTAADVYILLNTHASSQLRVVLQCLLPEDIRQRVGLLEVNVLRPWSLDRLLRVLPITTRTLRVFDPSPNQSGPLLGLILDGRATSRRMRNLEVLPLQNMPRDCINCTNWLAQISQDLEIADEALRYERLNRLSSADHTFAVFWGLGLVNQAGPPKLPITLRIALTLDAGLQQARVLDEYDQFGHLKGVRRQLLHLSASDVPCLRAFAELQVPDLLVVEDVKEILSVYDLFSNLGASSDALLVSQGWGIDELEKKIDRVSRHQLWMTFRAPEFTSSTQRKRKMGNLYLLNCQKFLKQFGLSEERRSKEMVMIEVGACLLLLKSSTKEEVARKIGARIRVGKEDPIPTELICQVLDGLEKVDIPPEWEIPQVKEDASRSTESLVEKSTKLSKLPNQIRYNSLKLLADRILVDPVAPSSIPTSLINKQLIFRQSYRSNWSALRPDLPENNYIVKVIEHRRLTPPDYDRNVFHLSLSTKGTNLKYAVGDALGVHGWNDAEDVRKFIEWSGLDAEEVVQVPLVNEKGEPRVQLRTVFQLLQQNIDLFGKPPKSFYAFLARHVTSSAERDVLRFIAAPEGASMYRKLSERQTLSYADVLRHYARSARLAIGELVSNIELIKPRHYSIASSQNFRPDAVDLLVVVVKWKTANGLEKLGQCTRYLAQLVVGDQVMVSLKPSVMRLPRLSTQPVIMAGLGTGAAPFRAFIQQRAWQKMKGEQIGPMIYYFGSRSERSEYLYREELEAFMKDGIISHSRFAFSRDGPRKVYIQDQIRIDGRMLSKLLLGDGQAEGQGVFYLCGPTWPVPDVFEVLCTGIMEERGLEKAGAVECLERLKSEERYVLEVY